LSTWEQDFFLHPVLSFQRRRLVFSDNDQFFNVLCFENSKHLIPLTF
jgi:hypothetical protein